jgi:NET1-associated nuclear protein 1 (U3 small nucleolar RNA-associated protein 17)
MATLDAREGDDLFHGEAYLKFWKWDKASAHWTLNTRIDKPHGQKGVGAMSFSSAPSCLLVTTGQDGIIKLWRLRVTGRGKNDMLECKSKLLPEDCVLKAI